MIGEHIAAEAVPGGLVAEVKAVLAARYGAEEDVKVHTAQEEYMAVAYGSAAAAHYGLAHELASALAVRVLFHTRAGEVRFQLSAGAVPRVSSAIVI